MKIVEKREQLSGVISTYIRNYVVIGMRPSAFNNVACVCQISDVSSGTMESLRSVSELSFRKYVVVAVFVSVNCMLSEQKYVDIDLIYLQASHNFCK